MPQAHLPADDIGLPVSRETIERHINALIDLLDTLDVDSDLEPDLTDAATDREGDDPDYEPDTHDEPSLGFSTGGHYPENQVQDGFSFHMNTDAGRGLEDEHDGAEPDVDDEPMGGWANEGDQTSPRWIGTIYGGMLPSGQLA